MRNTITDMAPAKLLVVISLLLAVVLMAPQGLSGLSDLWRRWRSPAAKTGGQP